MKKKIKDLNVKDLHENFCGKVESCYFCPLKVIVNDGECWCKYDLLTIYHNEEIEVDLDEEIEVEDSE